MSQTINAETHFLAANGEIESIPSFVSNRNADAPLCSVIIPSYNYGKYLRETVESVLSQTLSSLELIIVDDGSTDSYTLEVVQSFVGTPRVHVLFRHNVGLAGARNSGIGIARGKYICCIDSDDLLQPSYLEQCIFELESHDNVGFVYAWAQLFGDEHSIWETRDFNIDIAKKENHTAVCSVYRKSDWMLVGGYGPKILGGLEDWEFWLRLGQLGRCGKVIPVPLFLYRKHGKTMWHETAAKCEQLMEHIRDRNPALYTNKRLFKKIKKYSSKSGHDFFPIALANIISKNNAIAVKKKLLVVLPWFKQGGAEILMLDILKGLSLYFHFTIVTTLPDLHPMQDSFSEVSQDIFYYPGKYGNKKDANHCAHFLSYLIETRHIDTVLGSGTWHFYESLSTIKSRYSSITIFDLLHNDASGHFISSVKYNAFIDQHICVSDKIKNSLVKNNIDEKKITSIRNGIDHKNIFYPRKDARKSLRKAFGIPENRPVIGFVGRASTEKRPLLFLKLLAKLSTAENAFGVFVGEGPLVDTIKDHIFELKLCNHIIFIEKMDRQDLWKIYEVCDILVNVSEIEGMPLTVLEAFATGCPVAAMQVGQLEAIINDGDNGILVAKDDFETLTHKLSALIRDTHQLSLLREKAANYFRQSGFTLEMMIEQYKKILLGKSNDTPTLQEKITVNVLNNKFYALTHRIINTEVYNNLLNFLNDKEIIFIVPCLKLSHSDHVISKYIDVLSSLKIKVGLIGTDEIDLQSTAIHANYLVLNSFQTWQQEDDSSKAMMLLKAFVNTPAIKTIHCMQSELGYEMINRYGSALKKYNKKIVTSIFYLNYRWDEMKYSTSSRIYADLFKNSDIVLSDNMFWYPFFKSVNQDTDFNHKKLFTPVETFSHSRTIDRVNTNKILWVSRMCNQKLFWILAQISHQLPSYHFVLYGEMPEDGVNKKRFSELLLLSNVEYRGAYQNIHEVDFHEFDFYLHTSFFEGLPNVLLEMIMQNIPVIVSDSGGIKEIVGDDYPWLVTDVLNPFAYVEKIHDYYQGNSRNDIYQRMLDMKKFLIEHHNLEKFSADYLQALDLTAI